MKAVQLVAALAALSFVMTTQAAAETPISEEELTTCASYYELISLAPDLKDLTSEQARKAFYAFSKKAGPGTDERVVEKMVQMRSEIKGRVNAANLVEFREKYDAQCRQSLRVVWCEAYRDLSDKACVN